MFLAENHKNSTIGDLERRIRISEEGQDEKHILSHWRYYFLLKYIEVDKKMSLPSKGSLMDAVNLGNSKKGARRRSIVEGVREHGNLEKNPKDPLNPVIKNNTLC